MNSIFVVVTFFFQMERMFLRSLFLHLPILLYQNVLEKSFEKFQDTCSQEVDLYTRQRLLHFTVCTIKSCPCVIILKNNAIIKLNCTNHNHNLKLTENVQNLLTGLKRRLV